MSNIYDNEPGLKLRELGRNAGGEPLISIITPYYNAGKYFEQTWRCVMNQSFPWFEWIIVNDGSTKTDTTEQLKAYAAKDRRIRVLEQPNKGAAAARNLAISHARADIVIPLDADDLIIPTYLECSYWALYFNPAAAWSFTDSVGFQEREYIWRAEFSAGRICRENMLTCTAAIRKTLITSVGGYDEIARYHHEDWELWLKLLQKKTTPVHLPLLGFWYRRTNNGSLSAVKGDSEAEAAALRHIRELAAKVDKSSTEKRYPYASPIGRYKPPKRSNWDRKMYTQRDKTRVLMLLPWMEMGGADLFNLDVVKGLNPEKYEVSILTTVHGENTWRQRFEEYVTDIFELPSFLDVENYAEFISYFILSRSIDVVFLSNSYYGYYLLPWLRKEFPELVLMDYVHMEEWYWRRGGYARTSGAMGGITERTYVCNEKTRQVLIKEFGRQPDSVKTLYIGVDKDRYSAQSVEYGSVRAELGLAPERPVVLFPCRMHPQKRPFLMLAIAKACIAEIPGIAFVAVGDGPQLEELREAAKPLAGSVFFVGRQADMRPYYRDSDITLICSLKEGLALTAYESLSMSTPVVSSDVGGQAELIDGTVGAIVPLYQDEEKDLDKRDFDHEEIERYVEAIRTIVSNKATYERMCQACRERIESAFSTEKMLMNLDTELQFLLSDAELQTARKNTSAALSRFAGFTDDFTTVYQEVEAYEAAFRYSFSIDTKNELMRLAGSKWGSRFIKLFFKLKLNRILR